MITVETLDDGRVRVTVKQHDHDGECSYSGAGGRCIRNAEASDTMDDPLALASAALGIDYPDLFEMVEEYKARQTA